MLGVMHGTGGATVQPCEECPIPDRNGMGSTTNTVYYLKDHLGNVRATLLREQPVHAGLLNWASNYPFGMRLTDGTMSSGQAALVSSYPQRHWYQGDYSELDPETGLQAFDLRMYSSRIGRWLSVDPYAQYWSPYLAMGNNPVSRVDPDGGADGDPNGGKPSLWQKIVHFFVGVINPSLEGISQKVPKSGKAPKHKQIKTPASEIGKTEASRPFNIGRLDAMRIVSSRNYNLDKAVNFVNQNSYDNYIKDKCGNCARAVRLAVEAGGLNTDSRPDSRSAKDYGPSVEDWGFTPVEVTIYKRGDIRVIQNYEGSKHGHMDMYNGSKWVSDFKQNGFWPGKGYRKHKPSFQIYRYLRNP